MALLSRCWADEALSVVGLALGCCAAVLVALAVVGLALDCYAGTECRAVGLYGLAGCCIAFALLCCRFGVACISGSVLKVRA